MACVEARISCVAECEAIVMIHRAPGRWSNAMDFLFSDQASGFYYTYPVIVDNRRCWKFGFTSLNTAIEFKLRFG